MSKKLAVVKETLNANFERRPGQVFLVAMAGLAGTIVGRAVAYRLFNN